MSYVSDDIGGSSEVAGILLVDDHPVVRERLAEIINPEADLHVCGEAADHLGALEAIAATKPDLVIVDLALRKSHGLDLIKDIQALFPGMKILVCSMHDELLYAGRAMAAGAAGYVMKDADGPTFVGAIRTVLSGQRFMSARLAAQVLGSFGASRPRGSTASPIEKLSDREFEVFRLFGEGQTAKEIAARLNLSPKTVSVHRDHIKEKMGFETSAEMIRQAVRWVESQR